MGRIAVTPSNRFRRLVVVPDVPANLPREVSHGRKDAPGEEISFDLREPEFDLIEPRRVRRREMQPHIGVRDQERAHRLGLVRGEIIENHGYHHARVTNTGLAVAHGWIDGDAVLPGHFNPHGSSL